MFGRRCVKMCGEEVGELSNCDNIGVTEGYLTSKLKVALNIFSDTHYCNGSILQLLKICPFFVS